MAAGQITVQPPYGTDLSRNAHDGIHVLAPPGRSPVTALPAMAGSVLHYGPHRDDKFSNLDILLDTRIDGQQYVLTLKDMLYVKGAYPNDSPSGVDLMGDQLDPLGDDVDTSDPYVPDIDPGFSYPHLGDINDPGSGCLNNGAPWPCTGEWRQTSSLLRWLPDFGHWWRMERGRTPPTFPNSQITLHDIFRDALAGTPIGAILFPRLYPTPPFNGFALQKPEDVLTRDEVSSLIDAIYKMFKEHSKCEESINKLLSELRESTKYNAGSIRDILENFRKNGDISVYESPNRSGVADPGHIHISSASYRTRDAATIMGEIIHSAAKFSDGKGGYISHYNDTAIADAFFKFGVVMSAEQYRKTYPEWVATRRQNSGADYVEASLAHAAIDIVCLDAVNSVTPKYAKP
jgi:hypothetical protein